LEECCCWVGCCGGDSPFGGLGHPFSSVVVIVIVVAIIVGGDDVSFFVISRSFVSYGGMGIGTQSRQYEW